MSQGSNDKSRPMMVRQGDVLLIPVDEVPDEAHRIEQPYGKVILALGEATGHAHVVADDLKAALFGVPAQTRGGAEEENRFLVLATNATLTHEEHAAIPLAAGAYQVVIQREFTPDERGDRWGRVSD